MSKITFYAIMTYEFHLNDTRANNKTPVYVNLQGLSMIRPLWTRMEVLENGSYDYRVIEMTDREANDSTRRIGDLDLYAIRFMDGMERAITYQDLYRLFDMMDQLNESSGGPLPTYGTIEGLNLVRTTRPESESDVN